MEIEIGFLRSGLHCQRKGFHGSVSLTATDQATDPVTDPVIEEWSVTCSDGPSLLVKPPTFLDA